MATIGGEESGGGIVHNNELCILNKGLANNKTKDLKVLSTFAKLSNSGVWGVGRVGSWLYGGRVSNLLQTPPTYNNILLEAMGPKTSGPVNQIGSGTLPLGMTKEHSRVKISQKDLKYGC